MTNDILRYNDKIDYDIRESKSGNLYLKSFVYIKKNKKPILIFKDALPVNGHKVYIKRTKELEDVDIYDTNPKSKKATEFLENPDNKEWIKRFRERWKIYYKGRKKEEILEKGPTDSEIYEKYIENLPLIAELETFMKNPLYQDWIEKFREKWKNDNLEKSERLRGPSNIEIFVAFLNEKLNN